MFMLTFLPVFQNKEKNLWIAQNELMIGIKY